MTPRSFFTFFVLGIAGWLGVAAADLEVHDLALRLVDLERLALLPQPGERSAMWSSRNRASSFDEATGKYLHWGRNFDGSGAIREENGWLVLAEMDGPGVIWRIWSAAPGDGHVRIHLDGNEAPTFDMPFIDYFRGSRAPFDYPSLAYSVAPPKREGGKAGGHNLFVPIPFRKSCKILAAPGWGSFYQINYASLPEGTDVASLSTTLSGEDKRALARVDAFLSERLGDDPSVLVGGKKAKRNAREIVRKRLTVEPGETVTAGDIRGPRAITSIRVKPILSERNAETALRAMAIRISWDNEERPSVWSPLGDFFGTFPGINRYRSLPLGMTDDGFYSYWFMPFAERGLVEIANDGAQAYALDVELTHAPLARPVAEYARFHAKWHRDAFPPEEPERWMDWTLLDTRGRGRFVGVMLHVWNPLGGWWGEGDEKFFVDEEKTPSTFGTGSEDYFGYAWCRSGFFQRPFHNQTFNSGRNKGHISVNRWQLADHVPFQRSFRGTIEKYFPQIRRGPEWIEAHQESCRYAAVAYWYLSPDGTDPYPALPLDERTGYYASSP